MTGYSLTLIPRSWAIGKIIIRNKIIWSLGPIRFSIHRNLKRWESLQT